MENKHTTLPKKDIITPQERTKKVGAYVKNCLKTVAVGTALGLNLASPGAIQADGLHQPVQPEFNITVPNRAKKLPLGFEVKNKSGSATLAPSTYQPIPCSEEFPQAGNLVKDAAFQIKKFLKSQRPRITKESLYYMLTDPNPNAISNSLIKTDEVCLRTEKVETVQGKNPTCPNSDKIKY